MTAFLVQTAFWMAALAVQYVALRPARRRQVIALAGRVWRPVAYRGHCLMSSARAVMRVVTLRPYTPSHASERHA
ncbi:hypothetical protein GCM10009530_63220 [Microbispora corallina]|uniref:Uncharacterized protein n=1 Tax=Microbispora corallina TaxID=83302 RepID=A0ABQ4GBT7_9ACTN|nr:hypothetical protein [Microbispora corallina]GIH44448.1 hypothetical protein Mco01_74480 [Microbispora corallina]